MPNEKKPLDDLIEQIDASVVTSAMQPLVDGFKDLAKAVKDFTDKEDDEKEDKEEESDPDIHEDKEDESDPDIHEDKEEPPHKAKEDDSDAMEKAIALDVTEYLDRWSRDLPALTSEVKALRKDNADLRKAVAAYADHSAALTKAVLSLAEVRKPAEASPAPVVAEAAGERFEAPVVLSVIPMEKLTKAVMSGVIDGRHFDNYTSTKRFDPNDITNDRLHKAVSAL
ncbi:MAG: hypothetical protein WC911_01915 [Thermoleophilia bacterium]